jgi:hypothetical protein
MRDDSIHRLCENSLEKLLRYCRKEKWSGYDPYDGLNSPLARPFKSRLLRTAIIQIVKRSPVNLRPLIGIKKSLNPKGIALALRALILLDEKNFADGLREDIEFLIDALTRSRCEGHENFCWGYNFDWQSRAFFAPLGTPNVVCTVFAAHALLDWHQKTGNQNALRMAESSCRFLLRSLNRSENQDGFCFSYTPTDRTQVHNVNLLACELLGRAGAINRDEEFLEEAERAVRWTLAWQRADGSWPYGEAKSQGWIDGFHTGYVLVSLRRLIEHLDKREWAYHLERGYDFYRKKFFLEDFTPRYYHDRTYPIDIHSSAQAIITFAELENCLALSSELAANSAKWAIENMQDDAGYFYFQKRRHHTNRISYLRWSQAWMLYALSFFLSRS